MKHFFLYFLTAVVVTSCVDKNKSPVRSLQNQASAKIEYPLIKRFGLPYSDSLQADSNTLIFIRSKPFDTTFLLEMQRHPGYLNVVYYRATPMDWAMVRSDADTSNELAHFDGFSFKTDVKLWSSLQEELKSKSFDTAKNENYPGCCDRPFYFLLFNAKRFINSNPVNEKILAQYTQFLKIKLLSKYDKYSVLH